MCVHRYIKQYRMISARCIYKGEAANVKGSILAHWWCSKIYKVTSSVCGSPMTVYYKCRGAPRISDYSSVLTFAKQISERSQHTSYPWLPRQHIPSEDEQRFCIASAWYNYYITCHRLWNNSVQHANNYPCLHTSLWEQKLYFYSAIPTHKWTTQYHLSFIILSSCTIADDHWATLAL